MFGHKEGEILKKHWNKYTGAWAGDGNSDLHKIW
jgi:hypothetical protein